MSELAAIPFKGPLADCLSKPPAPGTRLYWLGQAGFVIEIGGYRLVIDPYLSDSLATKYADGPFPHARMMAAPATPADLGGVDMVLTTHRHTDHMDAETLRPIFAGRPHVRLVAPAAVAEEAIARSGLPLDRLVLLDAGEIAQPLEGLRVTATPAAHEERERDAEGRHVFLGYAIEAAGARIWHSGDCVPFPGLVEAVAPFQPDIALLPVNGRSAELSKNGIPGNFTLREAMGTAEAIGASAMIAHHYGMFAFNTESPEAIDQAARTSAVPLFRAMTGIVYEHGAVSRR